MTKRRKRKASASIGMLVAYHDDDKSEENEEEGGKGEIIGHICTKFFFFDKKGANDRRKGFTSFRALFASLRTMFCLK